MECRLLREACERGMSIRLIGGVLIVFALTPWAALADTQQGGDSTPGQESSRGSSSSGGGAATARVLQARTPFGSGHLGLQEDLSDNWFRYRNYLANDLLDQATAELSDLVALQKQAGIPRATEIAEAMVYEGYVYLKQGDLSKARALFSSAIVLDRFQSEAYAALARTALRANKLAVWPFLKNNFLAVRYSTASFWDRFDMMANTGLSLGASLIAAFCIFAIVLLRKYGNLLYHDIHEAHAGGHGRDSATKLYMALAVGLPLLLFMGVWWAACWWVGLMWVYLSGRERLIAIAMLVFAAILPLGIAIYRVLYSSYRDPGIQLLVASRKPSDPRRLVEMMLSHVNRHPEDLDVQFALGNIYSQVGRYEEALGVYKRLIDRAPSYQMALVNTGNIFFHLRDYENAIKNYLRALQVDSNSALINYNTKAAYSERFDFSNADQYFRRAQQIDPSATNRFLSKSAMVVVDEEFTGWKVAHRMLSGRVSSGLERDPPLFREFLGRREVLGIVRSWYYPLLAGLLIGTMIYAMARARAGGCALNCVKCGRAFCRKCQRGVGRDRYCSQCAHIFIVKNGISEEARARKFGEIQGFSAALGRTLCILSLLLPGSERVLGEKPVRGFLALTGWLFLLSVSLFHGWLFSRPVPFDHYASQVTSGLLVALTLAYYAVYNGRTIMNPSRFTS